MVADIIQLIGVTMMLVAVWLLVAPERAVGITGVVVMLVGLAVERQERKDDDAG